MIAGVLARIKMCSEYVVVLPVAVAVAVKRGDAG